MSRTEIKELKERVTDDITKEGLNLNSIHMMDILCLAINKGYEDKIRDEKQDDGNLYVSAIFGTGQERSKKDLRKNIKKYSGPLDQATTSGARESIIQRSTFLGDLINKEYYVAPEEFNRQAQQPFCDFAQWISEKAFDEQHSINPVKPIIWLVIGHSRGAAIARILAHPIKRTHSCETSSYSTQVVVEMDDKVPTHRVITVSMGNGEIIKQYSLELHLLLFSAVPGLGSKDLLEFNRVSAKTLIDFLAANDKGLKGKAYKPLNHRRTINPGSNLFVHLPVRHPMVTKAEPDKIIHLEIEVLVSYLFLRFIGVPVDPNLLTTVVRDKSSSTVVTELKTIDLEEERGVFSAQSENDACVVALMYKLKLLKADENYALDSDTVNIHGGTDHRFLVMRASVYDSALEERLALAKLKSLAADSTELPLLGALFEEDDSPAGRAYRKFSQECLNKDGLNDPKLKDQNNLNKFLLLKTAAILDQDDKGQTWRVPELFTAIEKLSVFESFHIKNEILKFVETLPVECTSTALKKALTNKFLPYLLGKLKGKLNAKALEKFNDFLFAIQDTQLQLDDFIKETVNNNSIDYTFLQEILNKLPPKERGSYRNKVYAAINLQIEKLFEAFIDTSIAGLKEAKNTTKYCEEVLIPKLDIILLKFPEGKRPTMRSKAYDLIFPDPSKENLPRSKEIDAVNSFIFESVELLTDPTKESKSTIEECERRLADITRDLPATQGQEMRKRVLNTIFGVTQIKLADRGSSTSTSDQGLNC